MIKVAYGSVPKDGGTFTFYKNQRQQLKEHGVELICVAIGKQQALLWEKAYADEGCVLLAGSTRNIKEQSKTFVAWCENCEIDIVIAVNSEAILSAIPHLPEKFRLVARCANAFDHGYRITIVGYYRLMRVIALSPRLKDDLINQYEVDPRLIELIPNGIDSAPFEEAAVKKRGEGEKLQIGFLGRLEHNQKGVLHIPEIVSALKASDVPFHLHIAGKGKHGDLLRKLLETEINEGSVTFYGSLTHQEIPQYLGQLDFYLFPSHFEGMPNALLEAMAAGCIPICWRIEGITDFVIEQDRDGFLFQTGDYLALGEKMKWLNANRDTLEKYSGNAVNRVREMFNPEVCAEQYSRVFRHVMDQPIATWTPKPWRDFQIDPNFRHSWTELIPKQLKDKLNYWLDYIRLISGRKSKVS